MLIYASQYKYESRLALLLKIKPNVKLCKYKFAFTFLHC